MYVETKEQKVLRVLYHLARVEIDRFPAGPGATVGRVSNAPLEPLMQAPLTGRGCVAYSLKVMYVESHRRWVHAFDQHVTTDFLLRDDRAEARVRGQQASLALVHHYVTQTQYCPARLQPLVVSRGFSQVPASEWYFRETVLLPGDQIVVAGIGKRELDPKASAPQGYRGPAKTRLALQHGQTFPLVISNDSVVFEHSHENIVVPG